MEYLTRLQIQRSDLADRIAKNKAWIVSQQHAVNRGWQQASLGFPALLAHPAHASNQA